MRENLLTGLVDAASYNMARKQKELALFEQGRVYDHENNTFNEHEHLAALYSGHTVSAVSYTHLMPGFLVFLVSQFKISC